MAKFCGQCGGAIEIGERFCGGCGQPVAAAAAAAAPQSAPPPVWTGPAMTAAPPPPPPIAGWSTMPPPPPPVAAAPPAWTAGRQGLAGGLPPSPQPWGFQVTVAQQGDSIVRSMGLAKPGAPMGWIEMMLRGALLDARVYRQAALDVNGNGQAALALGATFLAASLGSYLLTMSIPGVFMVVTVLVQVVALAAGIGVMAACSHAIVQRKTGFGQIFRAMAYAQSPGVLGIVPVLGPLLGLWRIPTSLVAIREITAADGGKCAILLIIGGLASVVGAAALTPVLFGVFAFLR